MLSSKSVGYLSALFATMFMGSLGLFVKNLHVAPTVITLFRLGLSTIFIAALIVLQGNLKELKIKPSRHLFISGFSLSASVIFYVVAIQRTSMSNAVFLLYLGPVFASLAAFIFLKEMLKGVDIISLFLSTLGLLFMLRFNFRLDNIDIYGTLCGILAGLSYGMVIFANRGIQSNIGLSARSFYQFLFGALIAVPFAVGDVNMSDIYKNLVVLIAMAFICGFLGITLMFNAIKRLPAVEYGVLSYLEMFFATLFGIVFFREGMDIFKLIGGLLILSSGLLQVFKNSLEGVLSRKKSES